MSIKLSNKRVIDAIQQSKSMRDMLLLLGLCTTNGNYKTYRTFIIEHNVDTSHWTLRYGEKTKYGCYKPLKEWMQKGTNISSSKLKAKMLKAGLLREVCSICNSEPLWQGQKLVLVLDHINGDKTDNRESNLRLLCPNCNSQQATFCRPRTQKAPVLWACKKCKAFSPAPLRCA